MRLFLAVPLPEPVVDLVSRTIASLQREDWSIRWTAPGNAHLTLHFLGEVEPERAQLLRLALPGVIARHDAFALRTADLGVFPNMRRPRVLWLGLYGPAHRLQSLREAMGVVLQDLEFELEDKEFHPHITLGRVRDTHNARVRDLPARIRARFEQVSESGEVSHKDPLAVPVEQVVLVRSFLGSAGARYEILDRFPLRRDAERG
jgi:2'-5' RNA ligase